MYSWPKLGLQKKGGGDFLFFQVSPQFQLSFNYTYYTLKNKSIIKKYIKNKFMTQTVIKKGV
jgi:hypothetical protein